MSVVKINAISVPEGAGPELESRFAARAGAVENQAGFEGFQLRARAREHFALHLELLAADEIEAGEEAVQERPGVLLQLGPRPAGGEVGQADGEVVEEFRVEHGVPEGMVAIESSTQA